MKPPLKESLTMQKAFQYYYELGEKRTYRNVARKFNKSVEWLQQVSRKFQWIKRVDKRDREVSDQALEDYDKILRKANKQNLQLIQAFRHRFAERIQSGRIEIRPGDLDRLARLERLILGETTENIGVTTLSEVLKEYHEKKQLDEPNH